MNASTLPPTSGTARMRKASILLVNTGHAGFADLLNALNDLAHVTPTETDRSGALQRARESLPDLVIMDLTDFGSEDAEVIGNLRAIAAELPIIVISDALDDAQMRHLMKLRLHDWLRRPLAPSDLNNAILTGIRSSKQSNNKVHAIVSANGGAGATTLAVTLADSLGRSIGTGERGGVGLFDLDFSCGSCGDLLNLESTFSLESVLKNPSRVDAEFVSLIQQRHPSGFAVYSFRNRELVTHLNCYELVLRMLDAVTAQHSLTVLDIPYYETDWRQDVLAEVNSISIVCELNLPSIKQALALRDEFRSQLPKQPQVSVLINKTRRGLFGGRRIANARIKELFGDTPYLYFSDDTAALSEAMDRGLPLSGLNRSSRLLKEIATFAVKTLHIEGAKA